MKMISEGLYHTGPLQVIFSPHMTHGHAGSLRYILSLPHKSRESSDYTTRGEFAIVIRNFRTMSIDTSFCG